MLAEFHELTADSTGGRVIEGQLVPPSGDVSRAMFRMTTPGQSQTLGASRSAEHLQALTVDTIIHSLQAQSFHFPDLAEFGSLYGWIAVAGEPATLVIRASRGAIDVDAARVRFENRLWSAFEADPVEDGFPHPIEGILDQTLMEHSEHAPAWLLSLVLDSHHLSFGAAVLRCLGRLDKPVALTWRAALLRSALAQPEIELRDAAIAAAETWAEPELAPILREYGEPTAWLKQYLDQVIRDISE